MRPPPLPLPFRRAPQPHLRSSLSLRSPCRLLSTTPIPASAPNSPPLDSAKAQKHAYKASLAAKKALKQSRRSTTAPFENYEITCGIEVHAQLNTSRKLFSNARTLTTAPPNSCLAPLDASLPGTQPVLNPSILLPALHAALSLSCTPSPTSRFDRKHYFYWDQPAGYQITQFYSPLAKGGRLTLSPTWDDVAEELVIGVRQVQIEQDTGKTLSAPPVALVDLNRVGTPLVEIITDPFPVESRDVPAKVLAKIQGTLKAVGACVLGMEWGGLRADVNVSVAPRGSTELGQRCEIKNLSSFKAVTDAVMAEAERQVGILERGGEVKGETRGWNAEKGVTTRLRGKEGEVEYRYMPDPELPAVRLGEGVVEMAKSRMSMLPEEFLKGLVEEYGVSVKDAKTLLALNDGSTGSGGVVGYLKSIVAEVQTKTKGAQKETGKLVANWVLHELGGHLSSRQIEWPENPLPSERLSELLTLLLEGSITAPTAKKLLPRLLDAPATTATEIIDAENLRVLPIGDDELVAVIKGVMDTKRGQDVVAQLKTMAGDESDKVAKKRGGLMSFILGATMKELKGRVPAKKVEEMVGKVVAEEVGGK